MRPEDAETPEQASLMRWLGDRIEAEQAVITAARVLAHEKKNLKWGGQRAIDVLIAAVHKLEKIERSTPVAGECHR